MSEPDGPLLHRLPDSPLSDDILRELWKFAELADARGPYTWIYVLCWAFYRELFDILSDMERRQPIEPITVASGFTERFSVLAKTAHKAIADGSNADLTHAANGIAELIREIVSLSKLKFQRP